MIYAFQSNVPLSYSGRLSSMMIPTRLFILTRPTVVDLESRSQEVVFTIRVDQ